MPLHTPFDEIDLATLQRLVDDEVLEDRQLEYKRELNLNTKEQKREFLADVSAFANADGGHLIIGIAEQNGVPVEAGGIQRTSSNDEMQQQIQNLIRDGIEPHLLELQPKLIETGSGSVVLVIEIPQSWSKPHRVNFGRHRDFYIRNSNGKYPADVEELRQMFRHAESVGERIGDFINDRIDRISENRAPSKLAKVFPKLVFHIVPLSSVGPRQPVDLKHFADMVSPQFSTIGYNFDGIVLGRQRGTYIQVFWDGSIEYTQDFTLDSTTRKEQGLWIPSDLFESSVRGHFLPLFLSWQKMLKVSPPCFVYLSLLDVGGFRIKLNSHERSSAQVMRTYSKFEWDQPFDRYFIPIPGERTDSLNPDVDTLMRPVFDRVWQAAGYPRSPNYGSDGKWIGKI